MAQTSKVCQILLALWSGLKCLGVMTISISHDHNVICPVDTAGFCTWIMSVSTGKVWAFFRDAAGKRVKISPCLVWFCWITVPAIPGYRNCSSTTLPRRQDRRKKRSRALGLREQPAAPRKALQFTCPSALCVALGGVPWQHSASQQQWNSTLTSTEGKKRFSPNQSTAGFSIKNTPKRLWVMPNKFNNWWNHNKWQLQNTKQTRKMMA